MLLCYQVERDRALGLSFPGQQTRFIAWHIQQERHARIIDEFKQGVISRAKEKLAGIINEAESAPLERKRELLIEALKLEEIVSRLTNG